MPLRSDPAAPPAQSRRRSQGPVPLGDAGVHRRALARVAPLVSVLLALAWAPGAAADDPLHGTGDLRAFAMGALIGYEPWSSIHDRLLDDARRPWASGATGGVYRTTVDASGAKTCHPAHDPAQTEFLKEGATEAYARALAHHTTFSGPRDVVWIHAARQALLMLSSTRGFHGPDGKDLSGNNQCVLDLAVSIPTWIAVAEMVEEAGAFTRTERARFAAWLESEVYPLVAWASRVRRNNWGAAGSLAARMIARYVAPVRPVVIELAPELRVLLAEDAVAEHDAQQRARMGTAWAGDSRCARFGIQAHGGIPDELRRGAGGCDATDLPSGGDAGLSYQTMQVTLLVMHAEVMRREGDPSLFELPSPAGPPALLQSILFVIDNPAGGRSWDWGVRTGALRLADHYYDDPRLRDQIDANAHLGFRGGRILPYAQVDPRSGR